MHNQLERFVEAQQRDYQIALAEIKNGRKKSHWMWYIFPQILGLGVTPTSKFYAIKDADEARAFFNHSILGNRLIDICRELLKLDVTNATAIFGSPDDLKLKSSMTLFASLPQTNPVFQSVLDKFFNGETDEMTLHIINA